MSWNCWGLTAYRCKYISDHPHLWFLCPLCYIISHTSLRNHAEYLTTMLTSVHSCLFAHMLNLFLHQNGGMPLFIRHHKTVMFHDPAKAWWCIWQPVESSNFQHYCLFYSASRITTLVEQVATYLDLYQHVGVVAEHKESLKVSLTKCTLAIALARRPLHSHVQYTSA